MSNCDLRYSFLRDQHQRDGAHCNSVGIREHILVTVLILFLFGCLYVARTRAYVRVRADEEVIWNTRMEYLFRREWKIHFGID